MNSSALRVVLDPEERSAAVARRVVEGALAKGALTHLLDEALLLVTELVTNAVVHAGTLVDLEVETEAGGLRVEVADRGAGRPVMRAPSDTREGGRGLFLLDALATAWGTSSSPGRKAVWFRLGELPVLTHPPAVEVAAGPRRDAAFLTGLPPDFERQIGPERLVAELLQRLVEGLDRERGWVLAAAPGSGGGWGVRTSYDGWPPPDPEEFRRGGAPGHDATPFYDAAGDAVGAVVLPGPALTGDDRVLTRLVAERIGLVLREEQNRDAQRRTRGSLALLAEAGEMFAGTLNVRLAATLAARLVAPRLAPWAAVWTTHGQGAVLQAVAHTDEAREEELRAVLGGPAGKKLLTELLADPPVGPLMRLRPGRLVVPAGGEPAVLPLVARHRVRGLLMAGPAAASPDCADEAGLLVDLARMAALAVDNARLYEERTRVAEALQVSLLPPELPRVPGLQFGARYSAAGEGNEVGGDFYDVFPLGGGGWGIAIGDVCGKGATAAAITGIAREVLRLLTREGMAPPDALRRLNETLLNLRERGRFCSVALGVVQRTDGGLTVRFSSAGHPPPVLLTAAGDAGFVGGGGMLVGVLGEIDLSDDTVRLGSGDALVFYTDGLTERRCVAAPGRESLFGEQNLLAAVRAEAGRTAGHIAGALEAAAQRFDGGAEARDDLAVLVVRAGG